jgi:predicted nucleotidyltransferase
MAQKNIKLILQALKSALRKKYKQRIKELRLFGSYATGNAKPESDIDISLVIDAFDDIGTEIEQLGDIAAKLSLENNVVVSLHPIRYFDWQHHKTPFILNLKREGINF